MTESEWLNGNEPGAMLHYLVERASARKLRLFACASARQLWDLIRDGRSREGIEVSERFADGLAREVERSRAWAAAVEAHVDAPWYATRQALAAAWTVLLDITLGASRVVEDVTRVFARQAALDAAREGPVQKVRRTREDAAREARSRQCELLREVFGNPFTSLEVDPDWLLREHGAARHVAEAIYEERRWEDMPILADALEDAGCENEEILSHCRDRREHVRGCWVLDALLGHE